MTYDEVIWIMYHVEDLLIELNSCIENANDENITKLKNMLIAKRDHPYEDDLVPLYCARLFLSLGVNGIKILEDLIIQLGKKGRRSSAIIETLFLASMKKNNNLIYVSSDHYLVKFPEITAEMAEYAKNIVYELVNESLMDLELFYDIIQIIYIKEQFVINTEENPARISKLIVDILGESTIKINQKIINEFEKIILNADSKEEDCQVYLKQNPALIDPLAKEIIPKQKLGIDFITDFVVRKLNDEYILIEIEKPTTPIFTKANDFSSQFTHAIGQVLDFQEWVESNIAYAEKLMPNITSPTGILIIGLNSQLNEYQKKKLRRFNINNNGKIKVIPFDELLESANRLYNNMVSRTH